MSQFRTQCLRLLPYLRSKRGITALEASKNLHITSLHRRLSDLRDMGCVIEPMKGNQNGTHFNRYFATKVPKWLLDQIEKKEASHA